MARWDLVCGCDPWLCLHPGHILLVPVWRNVQVCIKQSTMSRPEGWTHVCEYHLPPCQVPPERETAVNCVTFLLCPSVPPVTVIGRAWGRAHETQVEHELERQGELVGCNWDCYPWHSSWTKHPNTPHGTDCSLGFLVLWILCVLPTLVLQWVILHGITSGGDPHCREQEELCSAQGPAAEQAGAGTGRAEVLLHGQCQK